MMHQIIKRYCFTMRDLHSPPLSLLLLLTSFSSFPKHRNSSFSLSLLMSCRIAPPVHPSGQELAPIRHGNDPGCPRSQGVGASEQQGRHEGGDPECHAGPGPLTDHTGGGSGGFKDQQVGLSSQGSSTSATFYITQRWLWVHSE